MKKIIVITILCTLFLSACGKDSVAQKIQDDIESIGEVTLDDEYLIEKTYETYNTLTDKQKNQVDNYADLLDARDKLDKLKAEAIIAQEEADRIKEEYLKKERKYYPEINDGINKLNSEVRKIINNTKVDIEIDTIIAENINKPANLSGNQIATWTGFFVYAKYAVIDDGKESYLYVASQDGYFKECQEITEERFNEKYQKATGNDCEKFEQLQEKFSKVSEQMISQMDLDYVTKIGENYYAKDETNNADFIFVVDLDDFEKQ